ncbi:Pyridine nucleotide-disulfide oxidoreductase, NAD-binding domain protein [Kalmanozyma brasiliensis GHG001]|uniref:FAD/NAD(P)-binding domain-containing protein n=1 Tax=Kalmanozyma brasiliensis (strain GHG001) TaxID=1365824 RepID=V5ECN1_KALBG|nr:Pyridine nucleotide-disulfide oxidoreductase, NAD-binding domain protein [Kalmanozyma brasiliensis GHG001]EST08196.1 Pyridine nucleotide-disulfide oxidoreductase, NAD-binding domain protein [Kalmanozyma brasiliensis GHG001]
MGAAAAKPRNVVIVGGSYVGIRLAQALLPSLPSTHRLVVVEANSHFHHLFTFPRFSVLRRGGEEKALVPYSHALVDAEKPGVEGRMVHARAVAIHESGEGGYLQLDRKVDDFGEKIDFDYLALATGTELREPWSLPSASHDGAQAKHEAVNTLRSYQDSIAAANQIVIVGGGAVGVQVACDIAEVYPGRNVTVVHSRERLMNTFHPDLHDVVAKRFAERGVRTRLGVRVDLPREGFPTFEEGKMVDVRLQDGSKLEADLVLMCTGQTPRSELLASYAPTAITKNGFISVQPTLQIQSPHPTVLHKRIFALGDIADSGAAKTVRSAIGQIQTVKNNILALIQGAQKLEHFNPGPSGIHLQLGLYESIKFANPTDGGEPRNGGVQRDSAADLGVERMWDSLRVPKGTNWKL